jgi:phage-related protein
MARKPARGEKPLDWVGSSNKDFLAFPEPVKDEMGNALGLAQFGGRHPKAKPWKGQGQGVFEIVEDHRGDTYRAIYTVRFGRSSTSSMPFRRSRRRGSGPAGQTSS